MSELTRRGFFRGVGAGTAALGALSATGGAAAQESHAYFAPLVGTRLGGAVVDSAEFHLGAVAVLLRDDAGNRFQIDVLRADPAQPGVRENAGLGFFLANRGNGRAPSDETHGKALIALVEWCAERNAQAPALMTWTERAAAHPRGAFLVC